MISKERLRWLVEHTWTLHNSDSIEKDMQAALREYLAILDAAPAVESALNAAMRIGLVYPSEGDSIGRLDARNKHTLTAAFESRDRAFLRQIAELHEKINMHFELFDAMDDENTALIVQLDAARAELEQARGEIAALNAGPCPGSGAPAIRPPMSTGIPTLLECGICGQFVRYDANGHCVTHAQQRED